MVGEMLGLTLSEVREMPLDEFYTWLGWVEVKNPKPKSDTIGRRGRR